jgi:hypothetical protein
MTRHRRERPRDTSEPSPAQADPTAEGVDPWDGAPHRADTFSPLLWVPHRIHRVSLASIEVRFKQQIVIQFHWSKTLINAG